MKLPDPDPYASSLNVSFRHFLENDVCWFMDPYAHSSFSGDDVWWFMDPYAHSSFSGKWRDVTWRDETFTDEAYGSE